MKTYEIRYAGDYSGNELYDRYFDHEAAKAALRKAVLCALAHGNKKLADSLHIC